MCCVMRVLCNVCDVCFGAETGHFDYKNSIMDNSLSYLKWLVCGFTMQFGGLDNTHIYLFRNVFTKVLFACHW